ncbi:hypothetical protein GQ457_01G004650 [Hibiscus cannabinus]
MPANFKGWFLLWHELGSNFKSKCIWVLSFFSFAWSIWLSRNDIVFKRAALDQNNLLDLCILRLSLWCKAKWPDAFPGSSAFVQDPSLFQEVITTKKDTHKILWLPPPLGSVKFNVDGAVCGGVGSAGIGGILRDSYNRTLILFSKAAGNADATSAELFAIREACFLFQASPWSSSNSLIIECDCSLVVEWFHCSSKAPVIFKQILLECFTICERCSWRVCATSRSCNATADKLAKQGINRVKDMRHVLPLRLPLGDGLKCGLEVFILIM